MAIALMLTGACGASTGAGRDAAVTLDLDLGSARDLSSALDLGEVPVDAAMPLSPLIAARPYKTKIPSSYDPTKPTPLLIMFHGYASSAEKHEAYFQFAPVAEAQGFLYAYPDGVKDAVGNQGWNATDACCFFTTPKPDDVAYVSAILDDMSARYNVDPKRIFLVGHSNGAFLSHRLGCELAPRIAAFVSMAGGVWNDPSQCTPTAPLSVVELHATDDPIVNYDGGAIFPSVTPLYPSAHATVATWATKNNCTTALTDTGAPLDLVADVAGAETTVERYGGCNAGVSVELWTMNGIVATSAHQPSLAPSFAATIWSFLNAHAKP
jgi:polyhydroxybutyrate depolymerase